MSTTGKIAITFLGAGGALGAAAVMESSDGRRVVMELIERAGVRDALLSTAEKIVIQVAQATFAGARAMLS